MKQRKQLIKILIAGVLLVLASILPVPLEARIVLFLCSYAIVGLHVLIKAVKNILRGQVFDENFLMAIATIGAFLVGEFSEGVAVMLFYQVGELFESYAVRQSRKSITALMDIRPEYANIKRDGKLVQVDPEEVELGVEVVVKPGERIPLDGIVIEGRTTLDTKALTGESLPREIQAGDEIISGCINITGTITIRVTKEYEDSTVAKILELVEHASTKKAKAENFITKFAKYYTPTVVIVAVMLACLPPLLFADETLRDWGYRALIFLVVSCPCALVISIPLGFFGGIGGASKQGILIKGSNYLEALAKANTVVFDKTGTLTEGKFEVSKITPVGIEKEELLRITAYAECYSNHPISLSIQKEYGKEIKGEVVSEVNEVAGFGVSAKIDGEDVIAGNHKWMKQHNISFDESKEIGTTVYVAINKQYKGCITIADIVKKDAKDSIKALKEIGISKTVMLTGDRKEVGKSVGNSLGIDEVYTELLPQEKVEKVEQLLSQQRGLGNLVYVGDGINDAPVLARADIGIAMGGLGSDAAIEAADVVIMTDEPSKIKTAIELSKYTLLIVKQNIVFALGVKLVVLILGALGYSNMWEAVFADVGVSVIAILNSMRALKYKQK